MAAQTSLGPQAAITPLPRTKRSTAVFFMLVLVLMVATLSPHARLLTPMAHFHWTGHPLSDRLLQFLFPAVGLSAGTTSSITLAISLIQHRACKRTGARSS